MVVKTFCWQKYVYYFWKNRNFYRKIIMCHIEQRNLKGRSGYKFSHFWRKKFVHPHRDIYGPYEHEIKTKTAPLDVFSGTCDILGHQIAFENFLSENCLSMKSGKIVIVFFLSYFFDKKVQTFVSWAPFQISLL